MATYERRRYLFMTTDPVHIGTGGYRLGRVDNSIVREPGTRIPKIPGTALHGAARAYAARIYEKPTCAGQGSDRGGKKGHCGQDDCPICYTFGYIRRNAGQEGGAAGYSGVVNVFDARVLLFPVYSMAGPVWVSTPERLQEAGFKVNKADASDCEVKSPASGSALFAWERSEPLNLGWLMVGCGSDKKIEVAAPNEWENDKRWKEIKERIVLVQQSIFSQVVNSNLEVRTSVAIDPERGAAEEGALFTYEAIPRATFLIADAVLDDYRQGGSTNAFPKEKTDKGHALPEKKWERAWDVLDAGLGMIDWLGVGGMGTRGFGRMAVVGEPQIQKYGEGGEADEVSSDAAQS